MRRAPILLATGLATCMLLAAYGCGGGSSELSKAEFVKQADAICVDAQKQMSKTIGSEPKSLYGEPRQTKVLYGTTAKTLEAEADEIDALGAPSADAAQIEAIVASTRQVVSTIGDGEELDEKEFHEANSQMAKAEKLAHDYGLKSCLLSLS